MSAARCPVQPLMTTVVAKVPPHPAVEVRALGFTVVKCSRHASFRPSRDCTATPWAPKAGEHQVRRERPHQPVGPQ